MFDVHQAGYLIEKNEQHILYITHTYRGVRSEKTVRFLYLDSSLKR